ncbi:MAG TPA: SH3 domain-containing protein [Herpetosiphonaceae bacterium]
MAQKTHSSDWDRLFNPNAPRRRGPIALFITVSLVICFLGVVMLGSGFGANKYGEYIEARALTATPLWKEYYAQQTATAQAQNVTPVAQAPAETRASVVNAGNLRSEPRIAPETIVGQVTAGDVLVLLENRTVESGVWHRVRVVEPKGGVAAGTEGWISETLLK